MADETDRNGKGSERGVVKESERQTTRKLWGNVVAIRVRDRQTESRGGGVV